MSNIDCIVNEIEYTSDRRTVKEFLDLVEKQYISLGKKMQGLLVEKSKNNGLNFNPRPYMEGQRGYVWKRNKASNLLVSLLKSDDSISEMLVYRYDNKSHFRKTIDGQQRGTSLYLIVNDEIVFDTSKCIKRTFVIEGEVHNVSELHGKRFFELPELWQDIIMGRHLNWRCANNCSDEEAEEIYITVNDNTSPLSSTDLRRAGMGSEVRRTFNELKQADWWLHTITSQSKTGNLGDEILGHIITLIDNNFTPTSLLSENVNPTIYKFRDTGLPNDYIIKLTDMNFYLNNAIKIWVDELRTQNEIDNKGGNKKLANYNTYRFKNNEGKNLFNKTNTVMLMASALIAIKYNISEKDFAEWAKSFFTFQTNEYIEACGTKKRKAADEDCVADRIRLIYASMTSKFGTIEILGKEYDNENNDKIKEDDNTIYPDVSQLYNSEETNEEINNMMSEFKDPFEDDSEFLEEKAS